MFPREEETGAPEALPGSPGRGPGMERLLEEARRALAAGDAGRAVRLAGRALAAGAPPRPAHRVAAEALAAVLRETGLLGAGFGPGPVDAADLARGPAADTVRELVEALQRSLSVLAGLGEESALKDLHELAGTVTRPRILAAPAGPPAPSRIVVSLLCCERPGLLARTLGDLFRLEMPPADIVCLDDASRDPRVRQLLLGADPGPHRLHVLGNVGFTSRSPAIGTNAVLRYVEERLGGFAWLMIVDSDVALAPDAWTASLATWRALAGHEFPEGRVGLVTGFHAESAHPAVRLVEVNGVRARIKETVGACHLVIPRETWAEVLGPMDHLQDWGWCRRLRAHGLFPAATVPSRVQHLGEESLLWHARVDVAEDFVPAPGPREEPVPR